MSMRVETTYLAECDYPGCSRFYDFRSPTKEDVIETVIDDDEWLCLFDSDNEPRFFCPRHLRYEQCSPNISSTVFFDPDTPDAQPSLHALNKFYEDMITLQPLPKLECEDTILAIIAEGGHKMNQGCVEIESETKLSIVAGFALREGDQVVPETFVPVALTKCESLIDGLCVVAVQINDQPSSAYKLLAEYLRFIADDLEEKAEPAE